MCMNVFVCMYVWYVDLVPEEAGRRQRIPQNWVTDDCEMWMLGTKPRSSPEQPVLSHVYSPSRESLHFLLQTRNKESLLPGCWDNSMHTDACHED